jgi:uncharacterized membrane protein
MKRITKYFLSGLLWVAPVGLTLYILYRVFGWVDGLLAGPERDLLGYTVPGLGFVFIIVVIFLVGFLTSNFLTRWLFNLAGSLFTRLPLVKLLYTSVRDLLQAFIGEKKRFDKPVLVRVLPGSDTRAIGFITSEDLSMLGVEGLVAVYLPQSYNFSGNLIIVPRDLVTPLKVDAGTVMTFIVSGGISVSQSNV